MKKGSMDFFYFSKNEGFYPSKVKIQYNSFGNAEINVYFQNRIIHGRFYELREEFDSGVLGYSGLISLPNSYFTSYISGHRFINRFIGSQSAFAYYSKDYDYDGKDR